MDVNVISDGPVNTNCPREAWGWGIGGCYKDASGNWDPGVDVAEKI